MNLFQPIASKEFQAYFCSVDRKTFPAVIIIEPQPPKSCYKSNQAPILDIQTFTGCGEWRNIIPFFNTRLQFISFLQQNKDVSYYFLFYIAVILHKLIYNKYNPIILYYMLRSVDKFILFIYVSH